MSIRLLQSIFLAGVLSPVDGSTLRLSAQLEADLVTQGKAEWVAKPPLSADAGCFLGGVTNPVTNELIGLKTGSVDSVHIGDVNTPILLVGGDHPYAQWYGTNGANGMAQMYADVGIVPYVAVNTAPENSTIPGGSDQMSWDQLKGLKNKVEIVGHGHRHFQNNVAPTTGFTLTYTGAAATATFQVTGGNAVGVTAGAVADFSFSLSGASYDTLAELVAAINAVSGWSAKLASELAGTESSSNCASGAAVNAKSVNAQWPTGGAISILYLGATYKDVGIENDGSNLYVYGDGRRVATIALSGTYTAIVASLNAVSGITAALAGDTTSPLYVNGTEAGTGIASWYGIKWLSSMPVALEAGLSSSYILYRNLLVNKQTLEANGVTARSFAQPGGKYFRQGHASDVFTGVSRGNPLRYDLPGVCRQADVVDFIPHVSLNSTDYTTTAQLLALVRALECSPGYVMCLLNHKLYVDGTSGYALPTNDNASYDQTEARWMLMLGEIKDAVARGGIRLSKFSDLVSKLSRRPPPNWLFNPKFENSGAFGAQDIPGWSYAGTGITGPSIANGIVTLPFTSDTERQPLWQGVLLPPGTYELSADIGMSGFTAGYGVSPYIGRLNSLVPEGMLPGYTVMRDIHVRGNQRAHTTFDIPQNKPMPGYVKSVAVSWPLDMSTNKNIWLKIDGGATMATVDCSAGASNAAAVTAVEAAAAINAAIKAAGYSAEYHTAARIEAGYLVIQSPYTSGEGGNYVEVRNAASFSLTTTFFGNTANHVGHGRQSRYNWLSLPMAVGFAIQVNSGCTVTIARPMLKRVSPAYA